MLPGNKTRKYSNCLRSHLDRNYWDSYDKFSHQFLEILYKKCGPLVQDSIRNKCYEFAHTMFDKESPVDLYLTNPYVNRRTRYVFKGYVNSVLNASSHCMESFISECKSSKVKAYKILRFTMEQIGNLLEIDPSWKVIHVLRDPRGILLSRQRVQYFSRVWSANVEHEARKLCPRIMRDINVKKTLVEKFPTSFYTVKYEDFAAHPQEVTRDIYSFLQIPLPTNVTDWVRLNTQGLNSDGSILHQPKNSNQTAWAWRTKISPFVKSYIDSECAGVLLQMGYKI